MTSDGKKPGVVFWATVVAGLLMAYPLSQGPPGWLLGRNLENPTIMEWYLGFYWPLLIAEAWLDTNAPKWMSAAIVWYLALWS